MPKEIKDLAGLSAPLTKLIEVVSDGIGTLYKPRAMRKEADAEAYRIEQLATANAKKELIEGEAKIQLLERAKKRLVYQELTRQENIEEIAEKSIKYLENETVADEPVDSDWRAQFFNKAQDVSTEEMQDIWAKILASEVKKPGTISLRTLDVVSKLSSQEAISFETFCASVSNKEYYFDIDTNISKIVKTKGKYSKNKKEYTELRNKLIEFAGRNSLLNLTIQNQLLIELQDANLLRTNTKPYPTTTSFVMDKKVLRGELICVIGNKSYWINSGGSTIFQTSEFEVYALTPMGKELQSIIRKEFDLKYEKLILEFFDILGIQLTEYS